MTVTTTSLYGLAPLCAATAAIALDRLLGEPRRWHPLVGFGRLAAYLERTLNRCHSSRARGVLAWGLAVLPWLGLVWWLKQTGWGFVLDVALLYFALGAQSLSEHAQAVARPLAAGDLQQARQRVGWMVSRETALLDEEGVARATVESVLENGNDAVFGTLFWFAVAGGAGALLFRLANTLDAMWGYRTPRLLYFGWAAARLDDGLNFFPARLTALSYALLGQTRCALRCWRRQAPQWDSPNAGPVMSAGAGALGLQLGGAAYYHGQLEQRPGLGEGRSALCSDIGRAVALVQKTMLLWLLSAAGFCVLWGIYA